MSTHHVPPKDAKAERLSKARARVLETLSPFITGKDKDARLTQAIDGVMAVFTPLFKFSSDSKGATVMTEAATRNEAGTFSKGPKNL